MYPDDYVSSVYKIDFQKLYEEGYRGIIFDIDNTLVPHNAPADTRAMEFFSFLRQVGFKTVLLSNNGKSRVNAFCEAVAADAYVFKAGKPKIGGYQKAMSIIGTDNRTTLFIGDQIFTDIWGANRANMRTIMVEPVQKWKEEIQIILKRFLEAFIILGYQGVVKKQGPRQKVPML